MTKNESAFANALWNKLENYDEFSSIDGVELRGDQWIIMYTGRTVDTTHRECRSIIHDLIYSMAPRYGITVSGNGKMLWCHR